MSFIKHFTICVLVFCLSCTHIGCAQLIRLPFQLIAFALSIPFQVLKLAIKLLPIAIKYAPLALLFISNKDYDDLHTLESIVDGFNTDRVKCTMKKYALTPSVSCYQLRFIESVDDTTKLAHHIERILKKQDEACILFTGEVEKTYSPEMLLSLWRYMAREGIKVGRDKKLPFPYGYAEGENT